MILEKREIPTEEDILIAMDCAIRQVETDLHQFTEKFKVDGTTDNFYIPEENRSWTTGFWTGQIWIAYEMTNHERFRKAADVQVDSFLNRIKNKIEVDHHDMGFLYSLSCVAAYKLTGNVKGREAALLAADHLISRFQAEGNFFQAWGNVGANDNYRLIIDCLLNLPLLYWATRITGDSNYTRLAEMHINTSLQVLIREDHSTFHTFYFEKGTGRPLFGETCQGYSDSSAWARGQAWGIYGTALSYAYTKNEAYKDIFYKVADFFIDHLPEDLIPYWDFTFTDGSDEPRDSSSAAIAICGMLEMARYLDDDKAAYYRDVALKIVKSLFDNYSVRDPALSNGQLLHGVYARSSKFNTCENRNVDECNTWGDYFYMEALIRLLKDWQRYW